MPAIEYDVLIDVGRPDASEQVAVANAASYLSYADQTDTAGYLSEVYDTHAELVEEQGWLVSLFIRFRTADKHHRNRFEKELDILAKVRDFERVSSK